MTPRKPATKVSKAAFCATFGVSASQLERLFQQGMPHGKRGRNVEIPMPAGRVWYHEYLTEKGRKQAAPKSLDDARLRKLAAEAELAELELAEARDQLMTVEQYDRAIVDAYARVDAKLQNLSPRLAGAVLGAQNIQDAKRRIDPLIEEARTELRDGDDIPGDDAPDDTPDDREDAPADDNAEADEPNPEPLADDALPAA